MNKFISLVFLSLFVFSCNQNGGDEKNISTLRGTDPILYVEGPLPSEAFTFDTNITFLNANTDQQEKFDRAIEIIRKVIETEEFREEIFNYTYNGSRSFVDNGGYSNEQIYAKILEAAELKYPSRNNLMDMQVELYYADNSTIGYTYPSSTQIWVNTKFFSTNSVYSVAANLFHEWLHKLGFTHAVSYSESRSSSVPYAIGRMISQIGSANSF